MESGDWRSQLQADSRKRIMNRIMDTLRSHMQVYSDEGLQELRKIAVSIEEKVFIAATSESDYMRKVCFKILTIETRSQYAANSVTVNPSALLDFTNGEDWQEELYEKIKAMKDLYLQDLNDLNLKILHKLQQHNSVPQQLNNEQIEKLKVFKNMLERFMAFLQIPKRNILPNYKDKLSTYEDQIVRVINLNRRKPVPNQ
ncbi:hypothetical protein L2E82_48583 [Cichorium intybus]|uniref:Uncharacterized protein n=1 Tax=Cichorium intybus TaxID=13427 RepID=A0ACB8YYM0_CICIN|nr:hypothetical protein L2E82_48583 [Cichorium intybus]